MADHDQQRLIELDANESPKVVFKVSYLYFLLFAILYLQFLLWKVSMHFKLFWFVFNVFVSYKKF